MFGPKQQTTYYHQAREGWRMVGRVGSKGVAGWWAHEGLGPRGKNVAGVILPSSLHSEERSMGRGFLQNTHKTTPQGVL